MCGFINSILVTTPMSVMGFFWSNSTANPWCARTGAEADNRTKASRQAVNEVSLIVAPPTSDRELAFLYNLAFVRSRKMILQYRVRLLGRTGTLACPV